MQILKVNENDNKDKLKRLNKAAIEDAKKVIELTKKHHKGKKIFDSDFVDYNEEGNLIKLIKLIAKHDTNKLLPSTRNYLNLAESEVFNKLSPEGKALYTELMIKEVYK